MSVRVCIACCVWSEIRSRPEIASRRRFDLAGRSHLIRSISGSVRVYPNPVRSGSLFVLVGTRGREGGCPVGSRPIRAGPDAPQSRSRSQVPACSHRNGPCPKTSEGGQSVQSSYRPTRARLQRRTRGSEPAGTDATRVARSHAVYDPRVANPREGSVHQHVGEPATHVQHERRGVSRARAVRALSHSPSPPHALTPPVCAPSGGLSAPVSVCPVGRSGPVGRSVCSHERRPRRAVVPRRAVGVLL